MYFNTTHVPSRTVSTEIGELLFFSGTAYLGMPPDQNLHKLVIEGMATYGANYGVSRTSNLRLAIFEKAEQHLCQRTGAEAALTLSSGYMAGQLLVRRLRQLYPDAHFRYAPHTHPAILMENYQYPAVSFEQWSSNILEEIAKNPSEKYILLADTVNTLYGKTHDFSWLNQLPKDQKIILVIDDSHSFGVLGENGNGISELLPHYEHIELLVVSSLSKASGIPAGFVLSSQDIRTQLMESGFFRGSSPANPAYLYAFERLDAIYKQKHQQLQENIRYFAQKIKDVGIFSFSDNYPVFYTANDQLYPYLLENKVLVSSFAYPKSDGDIITRIIISALHTKADLDFLAEKINQFV